MYERLLNSFQLCMFQTILNGCSVVTALIYFCLEIPHHIFPNGPDSYRISYKRDAPGHYQIDAAIAGDGQNALHLISKKVNVNVDFNVGMNAHMFVCAACVRAPVSTCM